LVVIIALMTAACGEQPLAELGDVTNDWIGEEPAGEDSTTAPTAPSDSRSPVHQAADVNWENDALTGEGSAALLPEDAIAGVFDRRGSGDRFVQASRLEIAAALPGIEFPAMLPEDVEYVSSQLIFDGDGSLADDYLAAFGLWSTKPYTASRSVGQKAILWVAPAGDYAAGCDQFSNRAQCEDHVIDGRAGWRLTSGEEQTLVWVDGSYRYELFHRAGVPSSVAEMVAGSMVPLADLAHTMDDAIAGAVSPELEDDTASAPVDDS
jgi:hypothetical protein